MPTTERILDWLTMDLAGIDTSAVTIWTNPADTSLESYAAAGSRSGMVVLRFGECADCEGGGWDAAEYEWDQSLRDWVISGHPTWFETADALLAGVAEWMRAN